MTRTGRTFRWRSSPTIAGKRLSPIDLAPLDQFHTCGLAATVELAEMAAVRSGERVIDIGSGLGGPSRYLATKYGYPLSTTHVVSGAVMGAGATKRLSAVRWGVAGNIVAAWVLTIPAAAAVAAALYWPVQGIF